MIAASVGVPVRSSVWKLGILVVVLGLLVAVAGAPLGVVGTILVGVIALFLLEPGRGHVRPLADAREYARQARWEAGWHRDA